MAIIHIFLKILYLIINQFKGQEMPNGSGGSGGTINADPKPSIANPKTFVFLNGNSGVSGSTAQNNSATNANVGYGGGGASASSSYGSATGGSGGSGAYVQIIYNGGQVPNAYVLNYVLGAAGSGGANSGGPGGIKITWT
jgi:hypothetical protein